MALRRLSWAWSWPRLSFVAALAGFGLFAAAWVSDEPYAELEAQRGREEQLRADFVRKLAQAVNLPAVKAHHSALAQQEAAVQAARPMSFNAFATLVNRHGLRLERLEVADDTTTIRSQVVRSAHARISGDFHRFVALADAVAAGEAAFALRDQSWTATGSAPGLVLDCTVDIYRPMSPEERAAERARALAATKAKAARP